MLRNRHFISYFSTTLIYLSIAGIFLYVEQRMLVAAKKSEEKAITMCLSSFVPEVLPVIEEPIVEEEPVVEPEIIEEPIIEKEPEIEEEIIPEPIVEKVIPKPIVKKVKKKPEVKKKPKKKKIQKKKPQKKKVTKKKARKKVSASRSRSSKAEKNQFLANIRAKINKHKSYPRVAKKRRMQGSVKVKFTILRSGKVGNISLNGPKIFHNSARAAVKSAFPVNAKNAPISLPQSINLTLRYQLR